MGEQISFPRQSARTQRFTLGVPRNFAVGPERVAFLRARSGTDRVTCLWVYDLAARAERLVADPARMPDAGEEDLPPEERARRERLREGAGGVVAYAADEAVRRAAFALSGRLYVVDLDDPDSGPRELPVVTPVVDPRLDPTGERVAYVSGGALRVVGADGSGDRALADPDGPHVTWGLAEFIAAEEMGRLRGYWWAPDGERLLAARVDDTPVQRWYLSDPADPGDQPREIAYPAAGTANADVRLAVVSLDGERVDVAWDRQAFPYLVNAHWSRYGPPLLAVQSRDQRTLRVLAVDPATGGTEPVAEDTDPYWVEIFPGTPAWTPDGRLVTVRARDGAYQVFLDEEPATPGLNAHSVLAVTESGVLFRGWAEEPSEIHVFRVGADGVARLSAEPGVHAAAGNADTVVLTSARLDRPGTETRVLHGGVEVGRIASVAETPVISANVTLLKAGERALSCAVLLPRDHEPGRRLPVLMDPYGGPHAQRVLAAHNAHLIPQWFADQGFAVVVADGRGTPGRGTEWEREIAYDFAGVTLEDQVDALHAVAEEYPDLDLSRVAIRGWSFGGYLAALAVLRRPDVFHAGIAGAPVTDWRLYDTHYTERYLGHPDEKPEVYDANSLLADAPRLSRPLMIIHGLADDNVVAAHTLRLSRALLEAGRPHTVLPLSGVTHMTPQEVVAENLLLLQVDFLKRALGV
ncbi:peptidase S9 [Carbonactinospora thermoautotrophica]|uniref:Peptidase S9 n=2 Tax=Carbonactinospora thermoautotrophica TaxID=1469144 RepID=A0A132N4F0_9ACTN|nr:prolyl oligopeptidase family serine peptidase [Carbonactinospora thermoautotrophica]KWX04973.1 peptidase S9 [Carbonactinospora thermoautotrophica]